MLGFDGVFHAFHRGFLNSHLSWRHGRSFGRFVCRPRLSDLKRFFLEYPRLTIACHIEALMHLKNATFTDTDTRSVDFDTFKYCIQ